MGLYEIRKKMSEFQKTTGYLNLVLYSHKNEDLNPYSLTRPNLCTF